MVIINEQGRKGLREYKYQSSMSSWLDKKMNGFWEWVVTWVPMYVAPNLITFGATCQFCLSFACLQYYSSDLLTCAPSWIYYLMSVSLFVYQTLDAIDGKQARKTKSSSPLGQLFDHGCDALNFTPMMVTALACAQYGTTWVLHIVLMCGYVVFYMINWRGRHEGCLHFGIFSVTEAQFVGCIMFGLTGYFGCSFWQFRLKFLFNMSCRSIITVLMVLVANVTAYGEYKNVVKLYKNNRQKKDPGMYVELFQLTNFVLNMTLWNLVDILPTYPATYIWINCLIFSGMIHRLIVDEVTHMDTKPYHFLYLPLPFIGILSLFERLFNIRLFFSISMNSPLIVYSFLFYVLIFWFGYVYQVIHEICEIRNIRLFVVPTLPLNEQNQQKQPNQQNQQKQPQPLNQNENH